MDFLTDLQTASKVLEILQRLEGAQLELQIEMAGQNKTLGDTVPGTEDEPITYGERIDGLQDQVESVKKHFEGMEDLITQVRAMQDRRERQALES